MHAHFVSNNEMAPIAACPNIAQKFHKKLKLKLVHFDDKFML